MARQVRTYAAGERPACQVEVDGRWYDGELRMWVQRDDGTWEGQVRWYVGGSSRIDTFVGERVRAVTEAP